MSLRSTTALLGLPWVLLSCSSESSLESRAGATSGGAGVAAVGGWLAAGGSTGASGGTVDQPSAGGGLATGGGGMPDDPSQAGAGPGGTGGGTTPADTQLLEQLAEVKGLDAAGFQERTAVEFEPLAYDPTEALGLDIINQSSLQLSDDEMAKLAENGFVISTANVYPHFSYAFDTFYNLDLPLYVTADAILYALHSSYDAILKGFEQLSLIAEVTTVLSSARAQLSQGGLPDDLTDHLDVYLTVAHSLLVGEVQSPQRASNGEAVAELYDACLLASGQGSAELFGGTREVDFSQFTPRGHYTDSIALQRYFRAMIWLGRIDFRLMESDALGQLVLDRGQVEAMIALRALMTDEAKAAHRKVDDVVSAFVGEHDYMTPDQVDLLMDELKITSLAELDALSDEAIAAAILHGNFGLQRISSHIMLGGLGGDQTPLAMSFALFGQRYVIDSHVFSNVVYDRVKEKRMMPSPLDVAYAALKNDQAGMMLQAEVEAYDYASDLASMRILVDSEPESVWESNLYNRWLHSLQLLSPGAAWETEVDESLPGIFKTEAWGRRILNTQLASWAELRHDTLLYAKQSYTGGGTCEYPDAYVDPYPDFFFGVAEFAEHVLSIIEKQGFEIADTPTLDFDDPDYLEKVFSSGAGSALQKFVEVGNVLGEMAENQRTGAPHSEAHMAFINETVALAWGCGSPFAVNGWYGELFVDAPSALTWAPTIADVHTQPDDGFGNPVGKVLHVGTGDIRAMVVTVETCSGPRAYVGPVSSYYERIEHDFNRLSDEDWEDILRDEEPQSPQWVLSLTAQ